MTEIEPLHDDDPFAEIRPYSNREAPDVLRRLALDAELIETLAQWRLSRLNRIWPAFAQALARLWLQTDGASIVVSRGPAEPHCASTVAHDQENIPVLGQRY